MDMKNHLLAALREQLDRWEALLASLSEAQIIAPLPPSVLSIKDEIAHLWSWQGRSIARLEARKFGPQPDMPVWLTGLDVDANDNTDQVNAWIYATCRDIPWPQVHQSWRSRFLYMLELGQEFPEMELLDAGRDAWLGGHSLAFVLVYSYDHHQEHLDKLQARLAPQVQQSGR